MTLAVSRLSFPSPLGALTLFAENGRIVVVESGRAPDAGAADPVLTEARRQLEEYFDGKRRAFELPLDPAGTDKQRGLWRAMQAIPYGETESYGALARRAGTVARAAGQACGANPLPILIPCHRVLGADGTLGGYSFADGADTKRRLLRLEGAPCQPAAQP